MSDPSEPDARLRLLPSAVEGPSDGDGEADGLQGEAHTGDPGAPGDGDGEADHGPPTVLFELRCWPTHAQDLRRGDVVILEPTQGVLEVLSVRPTGRRVRVSVRVRGEGARRVDFLLPPRAVCFREPDDESW